MLVLSRRAGEEIIIDGNIRLTVIGAKGGRVRFGITAPPSIMINRKEVHDCLAARAGNVPRPAKKDRPAVRSRPRPNTMTHC